VTLAVLVEGTAAEERARALREIVGAGSVVAEPPPWWGRITQDEPLLEVRFPPARAAEALAAAQEAGFALRGSPVTGRYRLAPSGESPDAQSHGPAGGPSGGPADGQEGGQEDAGDAFARVVAGLRGRLEAMGGRVTVLASPYEGVELWGRVGTLPLMRRVKERFDPGRRMSPGRFVGGI
jgi:glycolate oxidase FAD binding subunit